MVVTKAAMETKTKEKEPGPLGKLSAEAHHTARDKGWWISVRTFGDLIALIHTEASEAMTEHRNGHRAGEVRAGEKLYPNPDTSDWAELETLAQNGVKPEGVGVELADVIIRIFDIAGAEGLDLDALVRLKMIYNRTRPYRHGNKVV